MKRSEIPVVVCVGVCVSWMSVVAFMSYLKEDWQVVVHVSKTTELHSSPMVLEKENP